jgi:hypothetical protein
MSSSKKIDLYRDYATGLYLSEAQNPTAPPYTLYTCIQYTYSVFTQGWVEGGDLTREKVRGDNSLQSGLKIQTRLTVSPVYKL